MCGRYLQTQQLVEILNRFGVTQPRAAIDARYNIAPTQEIPAIVIENGQRVLRTFRWGLVPRWADSPLIGSNLINARAETVATKPAFREALRHRRCLIPSDGFYEWRKERGGAKTPMCVRLKDRSLFGYAGIYERWTSPDGQTLETCAIITVPSNDLVATIHDRMPAILRPTDEATWLDPAVTDPEIVTPLLRPLESDLMELYAVSRAVNKPDVDNASLIDRAEAPPHTQGELF